MKLLMILKKLNPEIDLKLFLIHFQVVRNLIHKQIIKSRIVELSGKTIKFIRNLLIDTYVKLQITDLDLYLDYLQNLIREIIQILRKIREIHV